MIFNCDLHTELFDQGNSPFKFIVPVSHLAHNIRVHTGAVKFSWPYNIKTEFYQLCVKIMPYPKSFLCRTVHSGITPCLKG